MAPPPLVKTPPFPSVFEPPGGAMIVSTGRVVMMKMKLPVFLPVDVPVLATELTPEADPAFPDVIAPPDCMDNPSEPVVIK